MKVISWNVNGLRAILKKKFNQFLSDAKPDILCLQEIKISEVAIIKEGLNFPGYQVFWNSAQRPGYSGTATLVREGIKVSPLASFPWDDEGRIQVLELAKYYIVNVYFPNAQPELARIDFKIKFNDKLLKYLRTLKKPIIVCGDFNVAHEEIDLARPKENEGSPGYSLPERKWLNKFLQQGFVDTFRYFHPSKVQYSWWSFRMRARDRNVGWRIDYFCVSDKVISDIDKAFIWDQILGSDHCPVGIIIKN